MTLSLVNKYIKRKGLNTEDLSNQSKFLHFRPVRNEDKKDLIRMGECIFNFNFLDSIDQDEIRSNFYFNST
jgi:hypothetical protein